MQTTTTFWQNLTKTGRLSVIFGREMRMHTAVAYRVAKMFDTGRELFGVCTTVASCRSLCYRLQLNVNKWNVFFE